MRKHTRIRSKNKEVEWVLLFSKRIKAEAEKYGYPCIEVTKGENDLSAIRARLT